MSNSVGPVVFMWWGNGAATQRYSLRVVGTCGATQSKVQEVYNI